MPRIAFTMSVEAGQIDEYIKRHNPIWPELEATLKKHGVKDYSIFLDENTNTLFAYAIVEDLNRWEAIAKTEVCQRWWKHMAPLMPTNPDNSPISKPLREIFHIES
jgi:L-rhamnose mutarotase